MSFAAYLKSELCSLRLPAAHQKKACAYGLLLFSKSFEEAAVSMSTEHEETAARYAALLQATVALSAPPVCESRRLSKSRVLHTVDIENAADRQSILSAFGFDPQAPFAVNTALLKKGDAAAFFAAGAYLACGNISDPQKGYHLEFVAQSRALLEGLAQIIGFVNPKITLRRGAYILYLKGSESIEDLLTFIGATKSALALMDIKIIKDVRNQVNRQTNCETANIDKTVSASISQIEDITLVQKILGENGLPDELREIAKLRMENPDLSLRELGEALAPPLSRSGVHHRLRRIAQIAESLRKEQTE